MTDRQCETAQCITADWHYGKSTRTYNPDVFRARLGRLGQRINRIHELLSAGYTFDRLIVHMLGDLNDGSEIYPGQAHYQAVSDVREQAKELSQLAAGWLREMLRVWGAVQVEAVPGNHGRAGRFAHEAANWDLVALDYLQAEVRHDGIQVGFAAEGCDPFLRRVTVRGHSYLDYHGHDIYSFAGIPYYGLERRLLKWLSSVGVGQVDVMQVGHFHTAGIVPVGHSRCLMTGTMVTDDDYGLRRFGSDGCQQWWLYGTSDSRPVTWQYMIDLT